MDFDEDALGPTWDYKKKYRDTKNPLIQPESNFAGYNQVERNQRMFEFEKEKPATFINRPLTRGQIRKKVMRSLSKKDVRDWRNTPLLTKFLNPTGRLYNRYQSRLPTNIQRKVATTIKKMRNLGIVPMYGPLKPTDKIPLGSFIQDVEEMHKKTIDPVTGRLFMKYTLQDDLRDKQIRERNTL